MVTNYYQENHVVPSGLSDLAGMNSYHVVPVDPETKISYQYEKLSDTSYKMCAVFATSQMGTDEAGRKRVSYPTIYGDANQNWDHNKGNICFTRAIEPRLIKPQPQY
jgi:hypothetical protein